MLAPDNETLVGKKIAWLVPLVKPGSGGLQTVFRHVSYLQKIGAECHVIGCFDEASDNACFMADILRDSYQCEPAKILDSVEVGEQYDIAIATLNTTFPFLFALNTKKRAYFVQDYEPYFDEVGNNYINAQNTYRDDVSIITIGRWLVHKLKRTHGLRVRHTNFGADRSIYHPLNTTRKRAVCAIVQPDKSRRCPELIAETFELIHMLDPSVTLIAYGSNEHYPFKVPVENRGLITKQECNNLYNECMVGLCVSATNPSRIPFEMMAAGLPVVDVYRENTVWDFSEKATTLAVPNPPSLASAILLLLNSPELMKSYSNAGLEFMDARSGLVEQEDFARSLAEILDDADEGDLSVTRLYESKGVKAEKEVRDLYDTMKAERALRSLTPPAVTMTGRYIKVEISGISDEDIRAGIFVVVSAEDDPLLRLEYYEAFRATSESYVAQVDVCDFDTNPSLLRLRVFRKPIDDNPEFQLAERSIRVARDVERYGKLAVSRAEYELDDGHNLKLEFGTVPFVRNAKTVVKYLLKPDSARALKKKIQRFR